MRRFLQILTISLICSSFAIPLMEAGERDHAGRREKVEHNRSRTDRKQDNRGAYAAPQRNNRPSNRDNGQLNGQRKGANGHKDPGNSNSWRPGGNHNNGNHGNNNDGWRPGGNHNNGNHGNNNDRWRPGGNHNNGNHGSNNGWRPGGNNWRPDGNHNYRPQPDHGHYRPSLPPPPHRPHRPALRPYGPPPPPPPSFRPRYHFNPLKAILGFTFGTALNISLNALAQNNYIIDGYADNHVYLRNVAAMNFNWPDAVLYYNNGLLATSTFSYSTPYYNNQRYNSLYNSLVGMYGAPVSRTVIDNGWSSTWWGYDNRYITLEFRPVYTSAGGVRFYTTLIMGD